ncbi:MAG: hypothetical protein PHP97_01770 [Candidatus Shapirobacteria bacterium]|nr:hypothetical protein [Candidatus Shapirobacteria bacterium]MDD4382574.1 hypothetical protein [Candidatus Shapirobacteria bacterium]
MIYIFHGDNQLESRRSFSDFLDQNKNIDILRLDSKNITVDQVNLFLQESSLFNSKKILSISNLFSTNKSIIDQINKLINQIENIDVVIWQDKTITPTQLKTFKTAQVKNFPLDNKLFSCLNSIKPKNITKVIPLYHQVIDFGLYDLFLYFLKNNFRKQLTSYPKFDLQTTKRIYLQLIELDFKNKTGELTIPKELALERILVNLTK